MDRISFGISGGLGEKEIQKIRDDAFDLLDKVGVEIEDTEIVSELKRHKGIRAEGALVFYSGEIVEEFIRQVREQNDEYFLRVPGRDKPVIRPPYLCMRTWDLAADSARPATVEDLQRAAKLLDTYDAEGVAPIHPPDTPTRLRQMITAKTCYENSRGLGSYMPAFSVREMELLCEMGEAAGRKWPHVSLQVPHSPMKLDAKSLALILEMKRSKRTPRGITAGGGAMPLSGAAAPLLLPGLLSQGLAEALSAYGTAKLLNDKVGGFCSIFPATFDMRYSGLSMASPEAVLYWLAIRQLWKEVFGQEVGGDLACTAKTYDAQAGAQKTAAILTAVMSGATTFVSPGMTPTDEAFHFEGVVIDMEILAYALRVGRGLAWEKTPTSDIVREGRKERTFLVHPTTMRFREEIWDPPVFTNDSMSQWESAGSPSVVQRAAAVARERIDQHSYRPDKPVQKDLDRIMRIAEKDLA